MDLEREEGYPHRPPLGAAAWALSRESAIQNPHFQKMLVRFFHLPPPRPPPRPPPPRPPASSRPLRTSDVCMGARVCGVGARPRERPGRQALVARLEKNLGARFEKPCTPTRPWSWSAIVARRTAAAEGLLLIKEPGIREADADLNGLRSSAGTWRFAQASHLSCS